MKTPICDLLGITFYDLAKSARPQDDSGYFTEEQETELAADPRLFSFFYILISGWQIATIPRDFEITAAEVQKFLLRLRFLQKIDLLNKVDKPKSGRFAWQMPVLKKFPRKLIR